MLGPGLQFARGDDRFYNPAKARRNNRTQQLQRSKGKTVISDNPEPQTRPVSEDPPTTAPSSNLDRFLESTTPSVPAQYLSKTRMRGWRTCDVEFHPYFTLGDLWESFKEWSAYGAGVPLLLNGSDCVIQYYVPYLSGIQIYGQSAGRDVKMRRASEDSDGDYCRDSSSDGSSDCELERGLNFSREQWNRYHPAHVATEMGRLSLREKHAASQEGFSSDDGEVAISQGRLLFEFLEQDPPYSREPLADKILDLSSRFPELKTLRSCDLLSTSWISVAWYPIYRIPTGPTLKDLDACFLTYHYLSTPTRGGGSAEGPVVTHPHGMDGVPNISLPVFGLASYKFKGSLWTLNGGHDWKLANSLLQYADNWVRQLQVDHPDFQFFTAHSLSWR